MATKRVAFVTGASRGIGRCAALWLAEAGFDVAVAARTLRAGESSDLRADGTPYPGSLEETVAAVRHRGAEAHAVALDLLDRPGAEAAFDEVADHFGRVDVMVHNGLYMNPGTTSPLLEAKFDELSKLLEANVITNLALTQRAIRIMQKGGRGGAVISVTSGAYRMDPPSAVGEGGWAFPYAALKAAFTRLTPILHVEHFRDGICAYALEPGGIPTESFKAAFPPELLDLKMKDPGAHLVSEDVPASVIAWLAQGSEAARALAGKVMDCETLCREYSLLPEERILVAASGR